MESCSIIRPGEIIECPGCQIHIAKLTKPFYRGQIITLEAFEWISFSYTYGDETTCDKCGEYWSLSGHLHIKGKGWLPT